MDKNILITILVIAVIGAGVWIFWPRSSGTDTTNVPNVVNNVYSTTTNSGEDAPPGSIHNLPVPQAVAAVRARAASSLGLSESKVVVLTAYEREWPDGCLGLSAIGEFCTQALVPGYEVTVQASGKTYIYRTNIDGTNIRLQK